MAAELARRRNFLARWWSNLPMRDKGLLIVVLLPLATLVAAVLMPIPYTQQQRETAALIERVAAARDVQRELFIGLLDLESGLRGYALTRDPSLLTRVAAARESTPQHLERLGSLLFRAEDQQVFTEVSDLVTRQLEIADRLLPPGDAAGVPNAEAISEGLVAERPLLDGLRASLETLGRSQDAVVAASQAELDRRRQRLRPIILVTLFGGLAAALAAGWWFATDIAARVSALERNAERLANGERLHYEPSRGLDEIGSLDLTLRRAALRLRTRERELRDLNGRLERTVHEQMLLNRELEAFSYSVSHDLRAPLRSIDGFAQALREDWGDRLDETAQDHLSRVRNAAQRMGRLIDDLLKLSRLTRAQIQRTDVDLSALAREVAADLVDRSPARQVTWLIADGLRAWCDPALARIVLDNLLGNAWKFTSKTPEPRIEFDAVPDSSPRTFVVRDNGAGFDMRYVEKLFAPFQRLHGEREFPGTGIGLATVQRIVHKHGGEVKPMAEVGAGAAFYFTLEAGQGSEAVA
jgi:signal transduction histidine kinase